MSLAQALTWNTDQRHGVAARLRTAIRELLVTVDDLSCTQLLLPGGMARMTTTVELHGDGHTGRGEDVAYSGDTQKLLPDAFAKVAPLITGSWKFGELSDKLDAEFELELPAGTMGDDKPGFHRWAIDSALLDLALRQAKTDLARLVGAEWAPVRVSLSMGVDGAEGLAKLRSWIERDPSITFKLDTSTKWDHELVASLANLGDGRAVSTIDFKALYHGEWIDNDYDPSLYGSVANQLPAALLEDAKLTDANREALGVDGCERLSWDYPITSTQDVPGLPSSSAEFSDLRPGAINIKPSRFGALDKVLATIELCDAHDIPCYSGGQFELGVGRTQVQAIASLCFPDAPNDCAAAMFHNAAPDADDVPLGPVVPPAASNGFGWDAPTRAAAVS
jgi:L-alanine-DL-glutamate epimerase-like enolase superfamily enzyme